MAKTKTYDPRRSDGLWRAIVVVGWIFVVLAATLTLAYSYRVSLLSGINYMDYMREDSFIPGHEAELWIIGGLSLPYLLAYVVGAFLVMRWYLRSIRNARVLHRGITTSPAWVIWYFILPVVSLFRPYTMTSELWRSSLQPEGWKGLGDPALLRWWWGLVLLSGFLSLISSAASQSADTVGALLIAAVLAAASFAAQALAGVLFFGIGGPISRRQTDLVLANHRPRETPVPAWSA